MAIDSPIVVIETTETDIKYLVVGRGTLVLAAHGKRQSFEIHAPTVIAVGETMVTAQLVNAEEIATGWPNQPSNELPLIIYRYRPQPPPWDFMVR